MGSVWRSVAVPKDPMAPAPAPASFAMDAAIRVNSVQWLHCDCADAATVEHCGVIDLKHLETCLPSFYTEASVAKCLGGVFHCFPCRKCAKLC